MEKTQQITYERKIPLTKKVCEPCGKPFMGIPRQKYCSVGCKNKAAYWRNPTAHRHSRMRHYYRQKQRAEPS